jgi:cell fate (sporulation/competence/biofilm development) regulator YmcA (YheA/YmcA/DUF963 family)
MAMASLAALETYMEELEELARRCDDLRGILAHRVAEGRIRDNEEYERHRAAIWKYQRSRQQRLIEKYGSEKRV